jgi:hypothetical protein
VVQFQFKDFLFARSFENSGEQCPATGHDQIICTVQDDSDFLLWEII